MRIIVTSPPLADDTAYGYELRYLDMSRKLLEAGVTPQDLKDNAHNFQFAAEVIREDMKATLKDVVLGTPAGKMAMEEAMKKSCEDQIELLRKAEEMDRGLVITDVEGDVIDLSPTEEGVEVITLKKGGKNGKRTESSAS